MKTLSTAIILMACVALAADEQKPLGELDAKIMRNLASGKWSPASVAYVKEVWADYTNAHVSAVQRSTARSVSGKMPDAKEPDIYLGTYEGIPSDVPPDFSRPSPRAPSLTIAKTSDGRLFVEIEGHRIPAVYSNRTILFTTGDVVHSDLPPLDKQPYCKLEMFTVLRTGGKFYFTAPGVPSDLWREMTMRPVPEGAPTR